MYSTSRPSGETPLTTMPASLEPVAVGVVDLEPMAMPLVGDLRRHRPSRTFEPGTSRAG